MLGEGGGYLDSLHRWGLNRETEHKSRRYFNKLQEGKIHFSTVCTVVATTSEKEGQNGPAVVNVSPCGTWVTSPCSHLLHEHSKVSVTLSPLLQTGCWGAQGFLGERTCKYSGTEAGRCFYTRSMQMYRAYPSLCPCSQWSGSNLSLADYSFMVPESKAVAWEYMNRVLF